MPKFKIGISSCLLGQEVRYDGGHKRNDFILKQLSPYCEFTPICPEVEMGLSIPRPPMEIKFQSDIASQMVVIESGEDLTPLMNKYKEEKITFLKSKNLDGYILKKKSPSCDLQIGLFALYLQEQIPQTVVVSEIELTTPTEIEKFLKKLRREKHESI